MQIDIVTLFEGIFSGFFETSFVHRAIESGTLTVRCRSPREFGLGKHRSVDDTPYGGGSGMVMRVDVLVACMEALDADRPPPRGEPTNEAAPPPRAHRVLLTPQGKPLDQALVESLAARPSLMLIAGRYEGFDDRIRHYIDEEISLGDFVMTGGEVAAMAIIESTIRLLPGVLGNEGSTVEESHSPGNRGLLEYPQFTRPLEFRGATVPPILSSGHHKDIATWRRAESVERTKQLRPDVWAKIAPVFEAEAAAAAMKKKRRRKKGSDV